jgi:hypothetical protein
MRVRVRRALLAGLGVVLLGIGAGAPVAVGAEGCANEALRPVGSYSSRLPDCRAYEQVTPVNKDGTNPGGRNNGVQASASGDGIIFTVHANMPGASGGDEPYFLASRDGESWSSQGLQAPRQPHGHSRVLGWSEDLSLALDVVSEIGPGTGTGLYLRDSANGSFSLQAGITGVEVAYLEEASLAGFSVDNSSVIFETAARLLPSAAPEVVNLYELHNGVLSLVGVLPDGSIPAGGSSAGAGLGFYSARSAISSDGSRVYFNAGSNYVRVDGVRTVPVGAGGSFVGASSDGSKAFYLAGSDLVEFDLATEHTTDLTPGGGVLGVLGVSDDGSYVYFAANGVLAPGASPGTCSEESGECGLYVWHDGSIHYIATLLATTGGAEQGGSPGDHVDWFPANEGGGRQRLSEVAQDGRTLLFSSRQRLTSYDNRGFNEFYRYDAVGGGLVCVSCDPSGAAPLAPLSLFNLTSPLLEGSLPAILTRNLSADGSRVFFETRDPLVPQDVNGVQDDVYEWERVGAGSCRESSESFYASSGGCLYLISTGRSPDGSAFMDASANGDDVFFLTDQPLVGQDQDGLRDVYDARVGGGIAAQNPPAALAPCVGDACRGAAGLAPVLGAPASVVFSGVGNLAPPAPGAVVKVKPKKKKRVAPRRRHGRRKAKGSERAKGAGHVHGTTGRGR